MVFILFRYITPSLPYDFYAGDKKIVFDDIHYHSDKEEITNLISEDAVLEIRKVFPDFTGLLSMPTKMEIKQMSLKILMAGINSLWSFM